MRILRWPDNDFVPLQFQLRTQRHALRPQLIEHRGLVFERARDDFHASFLAHQPEASLYDIAACERRLREHADAVLRFLTDLRIPFTNNLGERAIRMPKVKQKISGCFRTLKGAQDFCTIRSYLDTMYKQGHNLFEVLRYTFMGCAPLPASC